MALLSRFFYVAQLLIYDVIRQLHVRFTPIATVQGKGPN